MTLPRILAALFAIVVCFLGIAAVERLTIYGSVAAVFAGALLFSWACGLFNQNPHP